MLDGLLYHESDLRIEEHYTDTAGFTDHVFALMHLLGFRFAPRIRDLGETRLYVPKGQAAYDALKPMIGGALNIKQVRDHWDEIMRLATSIKQGTVTASLMLRKLGSMGMTTLCCCVGSITTSSTTTRNPTRSSGCSRSRPPTSEELRSFQKRKRKRAR